MRFKEIPMAASRLSYTNANAGMIVLLLDMIGECFNIHADN